MKPKLPSPRRRTAAGFSLAEILVVVAIIFVLMGLGVAVFKRSGDTALAKQTELLLRECRAIASEYWTVTGLHINSSTGVNSPFDWSASYPVNNPDPPSSPSSRPDLRIERFVVAGLQLPATISMMGRLQSAQALKDTRKASEDSPTEDPNGFLEVIDAWGTSLVFMTRNTQTGSPTYDANYADPRFPEYPQPFFVSAGPDRLFGNLSAAAGSDAWKQAQDNIYSFKLE